MNWADDEHGIVVPRETLKRKGGGKKPAETKREKVKPWKRQQKEKRSNRYVSLSFAE